MKKNGCAKKHFRYIILTVSRIATGLVIAQTLIKRLNVNAQTVKRSNSEPGKEPVFKEMKSSQPTHRGRL